METTDFTDDTDYRETRVTTDYTDFTDYYKNNGSSGESVGKKSPDCHPERREGSPVVWASLRFLAFARNDMNAEWAE